MQTKTNQQTCEQESRTERAIRWMARLLGVGLGADLYAVELEYDSRWRRKHKFSRLAQFLGW